MHYFIFRKGAASNLTGLWNSPLSLHATANKVLHNVQQYMHSGMNLPVLRVQNACFIWVIHSHRADHMHNINWRFYCWNDFLPGFYNTYMLKNRRMELDRIYLWRIQAKTNYVRSSRPQLALH